MTTDIAGRAPSSDAVATPRVVRGPHGHTPYIAVAVKEGILWTRTITCSCGWGSAVSERTPYIADKALRSRHRAHVNEFTDRAPLRDYVVLLGLVAVIAAIMIAMATTVIDVSAVTGR